MPGRRQHHKGKKRAGTGWHKGRAQGAVNDKLLRHVIDPAFSRAADDMADVKRESDRAAAEIGDWKVMLLSIERTAPHAPGWRVCDEW